MWTIQSMPVMPIYACDMMQSVHYFVWFYASYSRPSSLFLSSSCVVMWNRCTWLVVNLSPCMLLLVHLKSSVYRCFALYRLKLAQMKSSLQKTNTTHAVNSISWHARISDLIVGQTSDLRRNHRKY